MKKKHIYDWIHLDKDTKSKDDIWEKKSAYDNRIFIIIIIIHDPICEKSEKKEKEKIISIQNDKWAYCVYTASRFRFLFIIYLCVKNKNKKKNIPLSIHYWIQWKIKMVWTNPNQTNKRHDILFWTFLVSFSIPFHSL